MYLLYVLYGELYIAAEICIFKLQQCTAVALTGTPELSPVRHTTTYNIVTFCY